MPTQGGPSDSGLHKIDARALAARAVLSGEQAPEDFEPHEGHRLHAPGRNFHVVSHLALQASGTHVFGLPDARLRRPVWGRVKRMMDVAGALALGVALSPLILATMVLLRREGAGILFRHRRVGLGGRSFSCLKFRTMVPDADHVLWEVLDRSPELKSEWLRNHKLKDDPRVTAVGRFLRRTSLDELPQLWNVLVGEMSLVGPRPVIPEELLRYGRCASQYLSVRPGITGLWQVTGRNRTSYRRRVALDAYYVRRQGLLLDLYILAKTTRVVVDGDGAY